MSDEKIPKIDKPDHTRGYPPISSPPPGPKKPEKDSGKK